MSGVNKAILVGHLGRDPETRRTKSGAPVVSFSLATSQSWRDKATGERKDRTQWHNVVVFNEALGKIAAEYLRKGSRAYVEGEIETREYVDKDGVTRRTTEIVLRPFHGAVTLLDRREREAPDPDAYGKTTTREDRRNPDDPRAPADPPPRDLDDDIPF